MSSVRCDRSPIKRLGLGGILIAFMLAGAALSAQTNPLPYIDQLTPVSVQPGKPDFTLKVLGSGFAAGAVLNWNGSPRVTEVVSTNQIKASITGADVAKAATASVAVVNPAPGGGKSNIVYLPIRNSATMVAFAPDNNLSGLGIITVGDFNNDGKMDIAAPTPNGEIAIYLGNGDGTFQAPIVSVYGYSIDWIYSADFNGDGNLDVVVGSDDGDGNCCFLYFYLGSGDGNLVQVQTYSTGAPVAAADFNGDGKLDLVTLDDSNYYPPDLEILLGNGDGTFNYGSEVYSTYSAVPAIGDFNGDGKLDLAYYSYDYDFDEGPYFYVQFGNGDGTFQNPVSLPVPYTGSVAIAADINGDGILDIVTDVLCVYLGNGDGTFQNPTCNPTGGVGLSLADLNGDGKLDAITSINGNMVALLGNGDGTFQNPILLATGGLVRQPRVRKRLAPPVSFLYFGSVVDFNNDGKLDLAVNNPTGPAVSLQSQAAMAPVQLSFGNANVGSTSAAQTATLSNLGTGTLHLQGFSLTGSNAAEFSQTNNCGKTLPAGESCQFQVVFRPKALGAMSAALNVAFIGTGSPQTIPLTGIGVTTLVTLAPSALSFPTQLINTVGTSQIATLTNTGTQPVTVSGIATTGPFSETNDCSSLYPSYSCQINVTFSPLAAGAAHGGLVVSDNAEGSRQTLSLSGTGTVVQLSDVGVNFGDEQVGTQSSAASITVTNKGGLAISISQIAITGTNAGDFAETNNCGSGLAGGASCTIVITFTPIATGARSATLSITDSGGGSPQTVALAGTGT
jgi:FG-GAP-like repeat/Abnormal spindle-like microcephaly-assoc'd, ASPM-SPD-2-Hydin